MVMNPAGRPEVLQLALLSAAILGVHHGFDYDHIAAITRLL
jgi:high-affinity nickel permease